MDQIINNLSKHLAYEKCVLAYSGGSDSTCLLLLLLASVPQNNIVLAHFNHQWGSHSTQNEQFVVTEAKKYQCHLEIGHAPTQGQTSENQAREQRYKFFNQIIEKHQAKYLLTAHHLQDNTETLIHRVCRGTGVYGLKGIAEKSTENPTYTLWRPLIHTSKSQIYEYISQHAYFQDPTNSSLDLTRNNIRHQIIPLCKDITSSFEKNISNLQQTIIEQFDFIQYTISQLPPECFSQVSQYQQLHISLQKEILRQLLTKHNISNITHTLISRLHQYLIQGASCKIEIYKNHYFTIHNDQFTIYKSAHTDNVQTPQIIFSLEPKETQTSLGTIQIIDSHVSIGAINTTDNHTIHVDLTNYKDRKLVWRTRQPGDYIYPLNCKYKCKLQNVLTNKKIKNKDTILLLAEVDSSEVLWITGVMISDKIKIDTHKKSTHKLIFTPSK